MSRDNRDIQIPVTTTPGSGGSGAGCDHQRQVVRDVMLTQSPDIQEIVLESKAKIHKHEEVRLRNMCSIQSLFQEKLIYNIMNL